MSEFNFKSAICTSREQSERLLALGLKKETADMVHCLKETAYIKDWFILPLYHGDRRYTVEKVPAWSLHRLIELAYGNWKEDIAPIYLGNSYDMLIGRIEFQVKQGKFNKEYLEE